MVNRTVAYLGPAGSYSELALRNYCVDSRGLECQSIAEVFDFVNRCEVDAGLVPLENVIQGSVTETLDLLFEYRERIFISDSFVQQIDHVLGVLPEDDLSQNISLERIILSEIRSHYQPLQQCANFLNKNFSSVLRVPVSSTSRAVELVVSEGSHGVGVIANRDILKQNGFKIIAENIADIANNQTLFILINRGNVAKDQICVDDSSLESVGERYVTSIALSPGRDRQGLLHEVLTITSVKSQVNLLSIHSRPDTKGGFVFFLELDGHFRDPPVAACLSALEAFCRHSTGHTAEVVIFGSYLRKLFFPAPFTKVGIVGGKGEMGRWFEIFFKNAGLDVLVYDLDSSIKLDSFIRSVQVVVISVPMSQVESVVDVLVPILHPGQLVVENCSIKNCALPKLLADTHEGVEVLGLHTMFGGRVSVLKGENVIITPTLKSGIMSKAFEDLFYKYGAHVRTASLDEHDRITAYTQSLIHLILLSLGEVMERSYGTEQDISAFSTPNSRDVVASLRRVLAQSDELISDLQVMNKEASAIRHKFLEVFLNLTYAIENGELNVLQRAAELGRKFIREDV